MTPPAMSPFTRSGIGERPIGERSITSRWIGTILLKDRVDPLRYVTIDTWESLEAYQQFRASFEAQYRDLDAVCAGFTTSEVSLGQFN